MERNVMPIADTAIYLYSFLVRLYSWIKAKKKSDIRYPIGIIHTLRSGESGKCWRPPVTAPIPTERSVQAIIIFQECLIFIHSSKNDPARKKNTPSTPVKIARPSEKNPWEIEPVIKLTPIYFVSVEKWAREKVIRIK